MDKHTREQLTALETATAQAYGIGSVREEFTVSPTQAQTINAKIKEQSDFLSKVNTIMVRDQQGEAIGLDVTPMIAARTNTDTTDRNPTEVHSLDSNAYQCSFTEYDTALKYATLDNWAKFPHFHQLINQQIQRQIALSRLMIAWSGNTVAKPTDPTTNTMGQDVNEGWLHKIKTRKASNYLIEGATAGKIQLGATGDYKNLDSLVYDVSLMLDDPHRNAGDLVAIVGRTLLAQEKVKFYDANATTPTEKSRIEDKQVIGTYGGLSVITVPYFPETGLLITSLKNLSIYIQDNSVRRHVVDNPKRSRYENYFSMNEDFVIEDYGKVAAIEAANIEFV